MPTRLLRECFDSELVNRLTCEAEVLFVRLIQIVDDYGRYEANPEKLKSRLFPLQSLRSVRISDITRWLEELEKPIENEKAGLIVMYTVSSKRFLEIQNFNQRVRSKSKYPSPLEAGLDLTVICPSSDRHMPDNCGQLSAQSYSYSEAHAQAQLDNNAREGNIEPFDVPISECSIPQEPAPETLSQFLVSEDVKNLAIEIEHIDSRIISRQTVDWLPEVLTLVDRDFVLDKLRSFRKAGGGTSPRFKAYLQPCIGEFLAKRDRMKGNSNDSKFNNRNQQNRPGGGRADKFKHVGTTICVD